MASQQPPYVRRNNETSETAQFTRSGRFLCLDGRWFFKTREGLDYGPYASRTECKYAYAEFIDVVSNQNDFSNSVQNAQRQNDLYDSSSDFKMPKISFG